MGRNSLITPHFRALDFGVHKQFRIPFAENHSLQFRLEAIRLLVVPRKAMT
jgi:hypothetical protein